MLLHFNKPSVLVKPQLSQIIIRFFKNNSTALRESRAPDLFPVEQTTQNSVAAHVVVLLSPIKDHFTAIFFRSHVKFDEKVIST